MEEKEKGGFSKQAEAAVYRSAQAGCPEASTTVAASMKDWYARS